MIGKCLFIHFLVFPFMYIKLLPKLVPGDFLRTPEIAVIQTTTALMSAENVKPLSRWWLEGYSVSPKLVTPTQAGAQENKRDFETWRIHAACISPRLPWAPACAGVTRVKNLKLCRAIALMSFLISLSLWLYFLFHHSLVSLLQKDAHLL
jgi:hypothetical protein